MAEELLARYHAAREAAQSRDIWRKIEAFKRSHAAFQQALHREGGARPSFDDEKAVSALYWELMLDEGARAFLESERALVERLARDMRAAAVSCDVDVSFLGGDAL